MRFVHNLVKGLIVIGAVAGAPLILPGGAPNALGQPTAATSDALENDNLIKARYEKGQAAEKAGNWQEAYEEYRAVVALAPTWRYKRALGLAALKIGKAAKAAQMLTHVLAAPEIKWKLTSKQLEDVRAALAKAMEKVGTLNVTGPEGAELWVGDTLIGTFPLKEDPFLDEGEQDLEARKGGAIVARAHVAVTGGKTESVTLAPVPPPSPTATAVAATAAPTATQSAAPVVTAQPLPTGSATTEPGPTGLEAALGPKYGVVLGLAGLSIAALAAGGGLWAASAGQGEEAQTLLQTFKGDHADDPDYCLTSPNDQVCVGIDNALRTQDALQTAAAISFIGGGVAAASALVLALVTRKGAPSGGARAVPVLGPGKAGLLIQGSF